VSIMCQNTCHDIC